MLINLYYSITHIATIMCYGCDIKKHISLNLPRTCHLPNTFMYRSLVNLTLGNSEAPPDDRNAEACEGPI